MNDRKILKNEILYKNSTKGELYIIYSNTLYLIQLNYVSNLKT